MRADETILLSDLDGTLFRSSGDVSPENRRAVEDYIRAGGMFAIATGRDPHNALNFIGDLPQNAPAVVINGGGVYDFARGEYLRCWFLDKEAMTPYLRRLMAAFPEMELQAYTQRGICYCTPPETANAQLMAMHQPCVFSTLDALLPEHSFFKLFLYGPKEQEESILAFLRRGEEAGLFRHVPGTTDVGGPITYHEMLPVGVSKGTAVAYIRTLPSVRGRTILAVGDYWNDWELLEEADVAVAPANAIDEIKAICRYTTASHNDHAIKRIIEDIIPIL